jgi:hypothetical protein
MTIWILALLLFACLAGIGYQQGAIRVAISFIGIIGAALLAGPLARLAKPAVSAVGVANPVLLWLLPPLIVFLIVLSLVKALGLLVHRKVNVHYRHQAGDLRLALWERLNSRLGLCLGLLNGLAYLVLISAVIYPLSYWTVQMAAPDTDPRGIKLFNRLGRDLQRTGAARVARAIDPMPAVFYAAADLAGLLYQNPLLEARLSRYPAFLSLAERPEFRSLAQDTTFTQARLMNAPLRDLLKNPNAQAIVNKPETLNYLWNTVSPELSDLTLFLTNQPDYLLRGKYRERILGRWYFDANGAMAAFRRAKPNVLPSEMARLRKSVTSTYAKTMLIAGPDHHVVIQNIPRVKQQAGQPPATELQTLQGQWKGQNGDYEFSLGEGGKRKAKLESGRLMVTGEGLDLVFRPED